MISAVNAASSSGLFGFFRCVERCWLDQLVKGSVTSLEEIAEREGCSKRHVERTLSNAFLAPQIIKAAVDGHLPRGVNAKALVDAPVEWTQQWQALGLQQG